MSLISSMEFEPGELSFGTGDALGIRQESDNSAVLALFENEASIAAVAHHAATISHALDHQLAMAKVSEFPNGSLPVDPISWRAGQSDYRHEVHAELARYGADTDGDLWLDIDRSLETLRSAAWKAHASIIITSRMADEEGLGATTLELLEHTDLSLLVVPETDRLGEGRYRRILVPVDLSSRADSVVPLVGRLAGASHGAAVTLVHVLPARARSYSSSIDSAGGQMNRGRDERNRAERHLADLKRALVASGSQVDIDIRGPADARLSLLELIDERDFDLVVISAHGQSALPHTACGSVARHLLSLSSAPVLLVRPGSRFINQKRKSPVQEQAIFRFRDD